MRKLRTTWPVIATVTVVVLIGGVAAAANPFVDIAGNSHEANIDAIYNAGITSGCDATHYCPNNNVTRAQMATFIARAAGLSSGTAKNMPVANARTAIQTYCTLATTSPGTYGTGPCTPSLSAVDQSASAGRGPSIAIGFDGNPVVAYGITNVLKSALCVDAACVEPALVQSLNGFGSPGLQQAIAVGPDGVPWIAFVDSQLDEVKSYKCASNTSCSGGIVTSMTTPGGGEHPSIVVPADGRPLITWLTAAGAVKVAKCANVYCNTTPDIHTVETGADPNFAAPIALLPSGEPVLTYHLATGNIVRYARCVDAICANPATIRTAAFGTAPDIAIGADGNPTIAYYEDSGHDLAVAKCNDANCVSPTVTPVDTVGDVGNHPSIAIGLDGRPVISYWDVANNDLKYARCANAACSGTPTTVATLDSAGDVGMENDITIGVDGRPVIAYLDDTHDWLKVARPAQA
jgi:hypothetical protein